MLVRIACPKSGATAQAFVESVRIRIRAALLEVGVERYVGSWTCLRRIK